MTEHSLQAHLDQLPTKGPCPPPVPLTKQSHVTRGKWFCGGGRLEVDEYDIYYILKTRKAPSATAEPLLAEKSWIANVE